MAFARFNGLAQDEFGNALTQCSIEVRNEENGFLAVLYSDPEGNTQLTNPFVSNDANFFFHAVGGNYRISAIKGNTQRTWRWQPLGTSQSTDVAELALTLQSGIIPVKTRVELNAYTPSLTPPQRALGGVVWGDATPALNGYYTFNYGANAWNKVRPLPDTLASLTVDSIADNVITAQASLGVDPAAVKAFYLDLGTWVNTGPVTIRVNGAAAIPLRDVNNLNMAPGLATGRLFISNEVTSLRMIVGGDIMGAVAQALQYVTAAQSAAELSRKWAEGAEPGGTGTKSSKQWAETAAQSAAGVDTAIQQVALSAVPVGHVKMRFGPLTPGYFAMGEGGVFDRAANPGLAAWLDTNGAGLGLTPAQIAAGTLPDWRDYSPRTAGGALGPALGAKQEDSIQNVTGRVLGGIGVGWNGNTGASGPFFETSFSAGYRTNLEVTTAGNGVNFDLSRSARTSTETRVKSFGVRWEIKAFGAFVNQGTADLVAIATNYQTLLNGALRKDVNQSASSLPAATKITLLSNILQAWELVPNGIINVGANTSYVQWNELQAYRELRLRGIYAPTDAVSGVVRVRLGSDGDLPDPGAIYSFQAFNSAATVATSGTTTAQTGFLLSGSGLNTSSAYWPTFVTDFFDFNRAAPTHILSNFQTVSAQYATGMVAGLMNRNEVQRLVQVYPDSGFLGVGSRFILEGIRG